ncbi:MAG: sugar transferase [Bacteriovoracaceae bacterium]|nr:sugar transferase [Bacteriovoracaceae bacterium]
MKFVFDIVCSFIAMIILLIPCIMIGIVIRLTSKGPAIFWTKRIGKDNNFFMMPKFRSMLIDTPQLATHLLSNSEQRITAIGKFLRKTSLDEIPQLYSILKGDMSFVGPRPALFNQDDLKEMRTQVGVHKLIPGVTGWAQINGRDEISLELKVKLDLEYLDKQSFFFDLKIILKTIMDVIRTKDISH